MPHQASLRAMWRNWAGDQACEPAASSGPRRRARSPRRSGARRPRGAACGSPGAGHSFTPAVLTDGALLRLDRMDRDRGRRPRDRACVRVARRHRRSATLNEELWRRTGWRSRTSATSTRRRSPARSPPAPTAPARGCPAWPRQVEAVELVTGGGRRASSSTGPTRTRCAPRGSALGALGVVTEVTLRCVPAFTLRGVDAPAPLDEVLDALDELVDGAPTTSSSSPSPTAGSRSRARTTPSTRRRAPRAARARRTSTTSCWRNHALRGALPARPRARRARSRALNRLAARVAGTERARRPLRPDLRQPAARALHGDGVRAAARRARPRRCARCRREAERFAGRLPARGALRRRATTRCSSPAGGRDTALRRGPRVPRHGVGAATSAPSRRSPTPTAAARTGASATSRPRRRSRPRYPGGTASRPCARGSTPTACSPTPTPTACSARRRAGAAAVSLRH